MLATRGIRVAVSIAVIALTGVTSGVVGSSIGGAATTPKITVTPSTNLHNGEAVKVTGKGFTPGDTVFFVECLANATGEAGCNVVGIPKSATITATGTLPTTHFRVTTGKVGTGTCGTTKANLKKCAVSVGNAGGTDSAVGRISFALGKTKKK